MTAGEISLPFEPPYDSEVALAVLSAHTIPGSESTDLSAGTHTRLIPTPSGPVAVTIRFAVDRVLVRTAADADPAAIAPVVRRWLDLDADLGEVRRALGADPLLGPLVAARPGLRVIGHPNGFAAAMTTVLGQQVSLAAARTFAGRLVAAYGIPGPAGLTVFPTPECVAAATPDELRQAVRIPASRARTLLALAEACADGLVIAPDGDHSDIRRRLLAVPGIGPWTADYLAVRVLGDRDAYPAGDLVLRRALGGVSEKVATAMAAAWSPYRAYALFQLWTQAVYGTSLAVGRA